MKDKFNQLFTKLKSTYKKHKKPIQVGLAITLVVGVGFSISALTSNEANVSRTEPTVVVKEQPKPVPKPKYYSPLTGLQVTEAQSKRPVTAIIIENSPDARPQSSLHEAGNVFEFIAEGGITRYLAFYQETRPDPIGPVRSLRPYFSDWILTFDASIAHVGGSAEALAEVPSLGVKDLDQFSHGGSYYRTTDRYAPHNVYTDFDKLDSLNKSLGFTSSDFTSWPRKTAKPIAVPKASKISVNISSYSYLGEFTWDRIHNNYKRSIAGLPMKDRETNTRITPAVVIVMEVNNSIAGDGRYHYNLVGSGKVTVFQDGNVQVGTWKKKSRNSQITFTSDGGNEIKLNPGQVWVTSISPSQEVEYTP